MSRFNKIILIGVVSGIPELKQTSSGDSVCTFSLEVARPDMENGSAKSDCFKVNAWRDLADLASGLSEGSVIVVDGSIRNRSFDNNEGNRVYVTEIEARTIKSIQVQSSSGDSSNASSSEAPAIPVIENVSSNSKPSFDFNDAIKSDEKSSEFVTQLGEDVPF